MADDPAAQIKRINPAELGTPPGYSQIVEVSARRLVFIAGQTATDRDGNVIGKNDFSVQAEQVFRNLATALAAAGCTAASLIKLTVFLRDMNNLAAYRTARDRFFAIVTAGSAGRDPGGSFTALRRGLFARDRGHRRDLISANRLVAAADRSPP